MKKSKNILKEEFWQKFFELEAKWLNELAKEDFFSYGIPKEEQIRADLYQFFRRNGFLVELESNRVLIENEKKKVRGEFDLRVRTAGFDLLIENKRAWAITKWSAEWNNKYSDFLKDWRKDIEKLRSLSDTKTWENPKSNKKKKLCFLLTTVYDDTNNKKIEERIIELQKILPEKPFKSKSHPLGKFKQQYYVWLFDL